MDKNTGHIYRYDSDAEKVELERQLKTRLTELTDGQAEALLHKLPEQRVEWANRKARRAAAAQTRRDAKRR
jgi:hypothetical protein